MELGNAHIARGESSGPILFASELFGQARQIRLTEIRDEGIDQRPLLPMDRLKPPMSNSIHLIRRGWLLLRKPDA